MQQTCFTRCFPRERAWGVLYEVLLATAKNISILPLYLQQVSLLSEQLLSSCKSALVLDAISIWLSEVTPIQMVTANTFS